MKGVNSFMMTAIVTFIVIALISPKAAAYIFIIFLLKILCS